MFLANIVWPALFLTQRILTWWAIGLALPIEYLAVREITKITPIKAILVTLFMNLVSCLLGIILIPLVGIIWEFFPGIVLYKVFSMGTFNPLTWIANLFLAGLINTGIEGRVVRHFSKNSLTRKDYIFLFFANLMTVGVAFGSLMLYPPQSW